MRVNFLLAKIFQVFAFTILLLVTPFYTLSSLIIIFSSSDLFTICLNLILLSVEEIGFLFAFYLCFMISGSFSFRISSPSTTKEITKTPFFSIIVPSHRTPFSILEKTLERDNVVRWPLSILGWPQSRGGPLFWSGRGDRSPPDQRSRRGRNNFR